MSRLILTEMPRNRSKAVPKDNDPFPHHDEFGSSEPTMAELYRMLEGRFDRLDKQLDELIGKMRATNQRLADLHRITLISHVEPDTKTPKRTEDAAADRAKHGSNSSLFEHIDYTAPRETLNSWFWMGFVISSFASVGFKGVYLTYYVSSPHASLINNTFFTSLQDLPSGEGVVLTH